MSTIIGTIWAVFALACFALAVAAPWILRDR